MARVLAALFSTFSTRAQRQAQRRSRIPLHRHMPPTFYFVDTNSTCFSSHSTSDALTSVRHCSPANLSLSLSLRAFFGEFRVSIFCIGRSLVCRPKYAQFSESCRRVMFCLWRVQWKFSTIISSIYLIVRESLLESCEDGRNWKCRWHKTIKYIKGNWKEEGKFAQFRLEANKRKCSVYSEVASNREKN